MYHLVNGQLKGLFEDLILIQGKTFSTIKCYKGTELYLKWSLSGMNHLVNGQLKGLLEELILIQGTLLSTIKHYKGTELYLKW